MVHVEQLRKGGDMSKTVQLEIILPGTPVAKQRARLSRNGHAYTPEKTAAWERWASMVIRNKAKLSRVALGHAGPVAIDAVFMFPNTLKSVPRDPHLGRQDVDNLLKSCMDAIEKSGLIENDRQIYIATAEKRWCDVLVGPQIVLDIKLEPELGE